MNRISMHHSNVCSPACPLSSVLCPLSVACHFSSVLCQSESLRPLSAGTGLSKCVCPWPISSVLSVSPLSSESVFSWTVACPPRSSVCLLLGPQSLKWGLTCCAPLSVRVTLSSVLCLESSVCLSGSLPGPCPLSSPHKQSPVLRPLPVFCSVLGL